MQNPSHYLFWFFVGCYVVDQKKWRWFILSTSWKFSRSIAGKDFPNYEMLDAKIQNSYFQKKVSLEEQKADQFLWRRQIAFMTTFKWLALMTQYLIVLIYSLLLFMITTFRNSNKMVTKFYCRCQNSIRWYLGKSVQIEDTWVWSAQNRIRIVRHGDSSEDIGSQLAKPENHGEEEYAEETSITKLRRQAWENWIRSSDKESKWIVRRWRRKRYLSPVERKRPVFARRPLQFPPPNPRSCTKTRTHCRHTFQANRVTRSKCVEEEKQPWVHSSTTVQKLFERYLHANVLWMLASARVPIL